MALTLTERLIRDRVNLTHENLEDIKSISLPGTFHEKIVSLGTSVRKFSRLKSLDLSRNALESLQGLDHLQLLEKLNLYYNNVTSLEELKRLRNNPNLRDLDLRLNPVTRNEPDYRLYLIHMLPNLQILDDRGVRDRERQAALTHFSSCQAAEMTPPTLALNSPSKSPLPRTEMMNKLMKGPSVLVDDDVAVIDMVNRNQGDLSKPRPLTGSSAKENKAEDYSLEHLKLLDQPSRMKAQEQGSRGQAYVMTMKEMVEPNLNDPKLVEYKERYPNILSGQLDGLQMIGDGVRHDPNLQFSDEIDANSRYRGQGYFTPNPETTAAINKEEREDQLNIRTGVATRSDHVDFVNSQQQNGRPAERKLKDSLQDIPTQQNLSRGQDQEKVLLYSLLNLVDRYWNGSKSLHKHQKFIEQSLKCVFEYNKAQKEGDSVHLKTQLFRLEEENSALRLSRSSEKAQYGAASMNEIELKRALKGAREDVESLHEELKVYVKENVALQRQLDYCSCSPKMQKNHSAAAASESSATSSGMLDEMQRQNFALHQELDQMRAKIKQYNQLQELASMLQESHKSLVETNEHLLREMKEAKNKHHHEIEQMHWSYEQLKSSIMLKDMSHYGRDNDSTTSNINNHNNAPTDLENIDIDSESRPSVMMY